MRVQNDLLLSLDTGDEAILILLDLTSAFDTVDHQTLQSRLQRRFGLSGTVAKWFASFLQGRQQQVLIDDTRSDPTELQWGVPQGSVIGPILFICYTAPLQDIIHAHGLSSMMYADDTQLYITVKPGQVSSVLPKIETCLSEIRSWMQENFLFLNDSKMEILHLSSHLRHVQEFPPISVNNTHTHPSKTVRNLGVVMDSHLSLRSQVNTLCQKASFALRRLGKVRRFLNKSSTEILVHAFISSILDNCNSLLAGINDRDIAKLQRIQNSAARLVSLCNKYEHITPTLQNLHWLPIKSRIKYKILLLTFKCINGSSPKYLSDLIVPYVPTKSLRSASQNLLVVKKGRTKTYGDRAFSCIAPILWNSLPHSLRSESCIHSFQTKLKSHLFCESY